MKCLQTCDNAQIGHGSLNDNVKEYTFVLKNLIDVFKHKKGEGRNKKRKEGGEGKITEMKEGKRREVKEEKGREER